MGTIYTNEVLEDQLSGCSFPRGQLRKRKSATETILRTERAIGEWELPFIVLVNEGLRIRDSYSVNALPSSIIVGRADRVTFVEPDFYFGSAENLGKAM